MLDILPALGLFFLGLWLARRFGWAWGLTGIWLNLLWFVYQNELGAGWLFYLRGVGLAFVLAAGYKQYWLAWALLPWPLLIYTRFDAQTLFPYLPAWGEGFILGAVVYLVAGLFKKP